MKVRGGSAVDQETEQFRPAVVTSRVHHMLPLVDQREIEVDGDFTFARADGLTQYASIGCDDRGEATAGERADVDGASVRGNLSLLVSIQPGRSANDKAPGFQRMLLDGDFRPLANPSPNMEPGNIAEWICSPSAIIAYRARGL